MNKTLTVIEATQKLEYFCSYQERCHDEVVAKLRSLGMIPEASDLIIVHLINNNFLNEERFACSFARGKHRIKSWGKIRIVNELKYRNISRFNIDKALKEISPEEYLETFHKTAESQWSLIHEKNVLKKRKKFCDYLLRKGFESQLIYEKVIELEITDFGSETEK
ncbi:regulatory protein RecX [Flavobacterium sp. 3HN19-14]|uniref:regulatory protein RecX n=1 Tax=Flavobacterium sp. 3HN19-14 TaxID=3448133 RepID=UPI003EE2197A